MSNCSCSSRVEEAACTLRSCEFDVVFDDEAATPHHYRSGTCAAPGRDALPVSSAHLLDLETRRAPQPGSRALVSGALVAALVQGRGTFDSGGIAARAASETLLAYLADLGPRTRAEAEQSARGALDWAGRRLFEAGDEIHTLTASVTMVLLTQDATTLAHVGDGLAYRFDGRDLRRLTSEHTTGGLLHRAGLLGAVEAMAPGPMARLTNALGAKAFAVDLVREPLLRPGERLLLCSRAVAARVDEARLRALLGGALLDTALEQIVHEAQREGGEEDIAVAGLERI